MTEQQFDETSANGESTAANTQGAEEYSLGAKRGREDSSQVGNLFAKITNFFSGAFSRDTNEEDISSGTGDPDQNDVSSAVPVDSEPIDSPTGKPFYGPNGEPIYGPDYDPTRPDSPQGTVTGIGAHIDDGPSIS